MNTEKSILGIIPARGGSKGIPRKNIRLLAGVPLIAYSIHAAAKSRFLSRFIVSTDDNEIAEVAQSLFAPVLMRPAELATDQAPTLPVILHVINELRRAGEFFDYVVLLQPTAPLRNAEDIDACLKLLLDSGADAVISVVRVPGHYHPDWQFVLDQGKLALYNGKPLEALLPRRQLLSDTYTRNGAIYAIRTGYLLENEKLLSSNTLVYEMPANRSVNIDTEIDFGIAEFYLSGKAKT